METRQSTKFQHMACIALLIIISFLVSACGRNLSRSKAAEIISQSKGLPESIFYRLPVAKVKHGLMDGGNNILLSDSTWDGHLRAWSTLESMGVISLKRLGYVGIYDTVDISLTDKGRTIFTQDSYISVDQKHFWKTEICKKVLVQVTGISKMDNGTAIVEYTWKYDNIGPVANAVLNISVLRGTNLDEVHKDKALMRKYDNGWRIVR